ncbi:hypothetical protein COLO4_14884 [Corchorus olitorius]|uniref:DUF674 domain-containing protein n=1 Tax=Corchorus olitorius TaxID=93759 RepID=A0A1R3JQJ1_9ROSI|nr:hypothetical protein COLO4_14884 [Corchorus olitorius]
MATSNSKVSLKLLIDSKRNKVLFAEAGKDFVDFLFNLLALPVGTVISLLNKNSMVGSLGNLYDSIENLSETYIQPSQNKDSLLNPRAPLTSSASQIQLLLSDDESMAKKAFMCANYHRNVADDPRSVCPHCKLIKDGYRGSLRAASKCCPREISITLLNKFNVKEVGALEEKVVDLGMDEGLKLLKSSLQSKSVLTNVFLGSCYK